MSQAITGTMKRYMNRRFSKDQSHTLCHPQENPQSLNKCVRTKAFFGDPSALFYGILSLLPLSTAFGSGRFTCGLRTFLRVIISTMLCYFYSVGWWSPFCWSCGDMMPPCTVLFNWCRRIKQSWWRSSQHWHSVKTHNNDRLYLLPSPVDRNHQYVATASAGRKRDSILSIDHCIYIVAHCRNFKTPPPRCSMYRYTQHTTIAT